MKIEPLNPTAWYRITLDDNADLKNELLDWADQEGIEFAWLQCVGQFRFADIASGHRKNETNSKKIIKELPTNRHVVALGTLSCNEERREVHLHGALGRGSRTVSGCVAKTPRVFGGMEVFLTVLDSEL